MPAPAVIPALVAYIKVVAVKKLVARVRDARQRLAERLNGVRVLSRL